MKKEKYLLILLMTIVSCSSGNQDKIHPNDLNLNIPGDVNVLYKNKDKTNVTNADQLKNQLTNYKVRFTLGTDNNQIFGRVEDALIDNDKRRIYILDTQEVGVKIYDFYGNYLGTQLRKGRGPGELIHPVKIKLKDNSIYILDQRSSIKKYTNKGDSLVYDSSIISNFPESFCLGNNHLFTKNMTVTGPDTGSYDKPVFKYAMDNLNEPIENFGKLYESNSWGVVMNMSVGGISCESNSSSLVQYFTYLNLFYGYDTTGTRNWISKINDFELIKLKEGVGSIGPDQTKLPMSFHTIENVVSIDERYFLVQLATKTIPTEGNSINKIDTYLINYDNGEGIFISDTIPYVLDLNSRLFVLLDNSGTPNIKFAEY